MEWVERMEWVEWVVELVYLRAYAEGGTTQEAVALGVRSAG